MEFITLEFIPRLQTCSVYIAMAMDISLKDIEVKLSESSILLIYKERSFQLSLPRINIIPTSLSAFNIKDNWICFRLRTVPPTCELGSFNTQILTGPNRLASVTNCSPPILNTIQSLLKTSKFSILCAGCKNVIAAPITFKRCLPFPDADCNVEEWFCCKYSCNRVSNSVQSQESDFLYGSYFTVLCKNIFGSNLRIDNKTLTCNKCLMHIGMVHDHNLYKIWNCSVIYKPQNDTLSVTNATDPLNDFLLIMKGSLTGILGRMIVLQTAVEEQMHYLLIKPMNCQLNLITEPNEINATDTISLQHKRVIKVLYKYETGIIDIAANSWNTTYYDIGFSVINAALEYLLLSTKRLPPNYAADADFCFGYINLQETGS